MRLIRTSPFIILSTIFLLACATSEQNVSDANFEKLDSLIQVMEVQGQEMAQSLDTVARYYEYLLTKKDSILDASVRNPYRYAGAISTNVPGQDSTLSSIIILNSTPNRTAAEQEVVFTNPLDRVFGQFIRDNQLAAQIYSNSVMQVSRVFPAYDAQNIVDPNIDVTSFNFFYEADLKHNPEKGLVWIPEAYVDPAGKGWILSLVHPVYEGERLFAVLGVDFTISNLIQKYLDSLEGEYILVNPKGDIVAGKAEAIESLSMPPLKNHVYRETVQSDYFRISDFNLFNSKSREVRKMAQKFLLEKENRFEFSEEADLKDAKCVPFNAIDWYLIEVSPNR